MPSGSAFDTANDKTYEVWIFDTGASFHITRDFSHLVEPIRCHLGLTVGGGACLHATHMGSVQLDMEIGVTGVLLTYERTVGKWRTVGNNIDSSQGSRTSVNACSIRTKL